MWANGSPGSAGVSPAVVAEGKRDACALRPDGFCRMEATEEINEASPQPLQRSAHELDQPCFGPEMSVVEQAFRDPLIALFARLPR
jgi:hypothetical protein